MCVYDTVYQEKSEYVTAQFCIEIVCIKISSNSHISKTLGKNLYGSNWYILGDQISQNKA